MASNTCAGKTVLYWRILNALYPSEEPQGLLVPVRVAVPPGEAACSRRGLLLTYNQMVVEELTDEAVDGMFHALADATRRDILRRSARGDRSVSELARGYPMSFAAVQKHVAVLERAGLVTKERRGREQLVRPAPEAVRRARGALEELELAWRGRVERMAGLLAEASADDKRRTRGHDR